MKTSRLFISSSNVKGVQLIPNKDYSLTTNDIIIYTVYLPNFKHLNVDLAAFLNSSELNRAARFYKQIDRNRFTVYRSILKFILAAHTKMEVKDIYLNYDLNKKPYLASQPWLYFNISHSEDYAVIAISRKKVGVDIEYMSKDFKFSNLLPDIFEDKEVLAIQNAGSKKHAFYTSWTRKEALVKALGKGIDEDFKYIPCLDGEHSLNSNIIKNNTKNWQVDSFDLANHYLGAIAFESLSIVPQNLLMYSIPNTMKDLLEMTQIKND